MTRRRRRLERSRAAARDFLSWAALAGDLRARAAWLLALALVAAATIVSAQQPTPYSANTLVDSVGVNVHLHYDGTLYRENFPLIKSRLIELGVKHVRDGLIDTTWQPYIDRHNELGRAGIKGIFIAAPATATPVMQAFPARLADSFEGYEAANEYDLAGDPNWPQTLRESLVRLRGLRDVSALARWPVIGPSLTQPSAYAALGDVSTLVDFGNLHNYLAGRNPGTPGWGAGGYGSFEWNTALARRIFGAKPIITTETGFLDNPDAADSIPPAVIARYLPRLLLEQFRRGIPRTYIYELADFAGSESYGLLNADGSVKPAFRAVQNLLALLADPGARVQPGRVGNLVTGAGRTGRVMYFRKRDGRLFVAVWLEHYGWDVNLRRALVVTPENWTLTLPNGLTLHAIHRWQDDGNVASDHTRRGRGSHPIAVSDSLTLLEIHRSGVAEPPRGVRLIPEVPSTVRDLSGVRLARHPGPRHATQPGVQPRRRGGAVPVAD